MFKLFIFFITAFILLVVSNLVLLAQTPVLQRPQMPVYKSGSLTPDGIQKKGLKKFVKKRKKIHKRALPQADSNRLSPLSRGFPIHHEAEEMQRKVLSSSLASSDSVREEWVREYTSGMASAWDRVNAVVVDLSGNVYVTGASTNLPLGSDYLSMKLSNSGDTLWTARYDYLVSGDDDATALAVDGSGNVYVTGLSYGSGTDYDYATIKYNSAGVQQWVARYNGPGNSSDYAYALAIDDSGNVYVTGLSYGSGTDYDYATIKYNSAGVQQWVARYNGPGNSSDYAYALAVDGSGNVYVTGSSYSSGTDYDYATVKYNSAGVQQWAARYNGTGNYSDDAYALAVDGSGNVYVTGSSYGSGGDYDYATVKYNSAGVQQWAARYSRPGNYSDYAYVLAIDGSGNVYVTGSSYGLGTDYDYATVKYNSAGVQQWAALYNGTGNSSDNATALAVDGSGNVYVTGSSYGSGTDYDYATVKYNSAGVQQWAARYDGSGNYSDYAYALAIDGSGNVYVTGSSYGSSTDYDYATIKYNSAGVQQWVALYNGPGNSWEDTYALAVDGSGNVYVTGSSYDLGADYDYATVKYNSAGVQQWVARYKGPGNSSDDAYAISVDGSGNVYVTGSSHGSSTDYDYATVKYNSAGAQQWAARYNGPGNSSDDAYALAVDGSGNVYVTGSSYSSGTDYDYATVKYNSAGVQQWAALYDGPKNSSDDAYALAVDGSGNVYVTGSSYGSGADYDYATVKYNSAGVQQWAARYSRKGNSWEDAYALALDGSGNVYVTGLCYDSGTDYDFATVKYNSAGAQQWEAFYNGPGNSSDYAYALALDGSGNVYVTGSSYDSGTDYDYATVKYNSAGVQQWVNRYDGSGNSSDYAYALAVDGSDNVYVTGSSYGSGTDYDYATVKYNSAGVQQWVDRYNRPGNSSDDAYALAVDGSGNVYVTGSCYGIGWSVYTTIKYLQQPTSVKEQAGMLIQYSLSQNYPNPFNPTTMIKFFVGTYSYTSLQVYDLLGREVATLVNEQKPAGTYTKQWNASNLPSGVYFYRLQTGSFTQTKKLLLLK
jgi:uncharacterized delta-60 repeat protein